VILCPQHTATPLVNLTRTNEKAGNVLENGLVIQMFEFRRAHQRFVGYAAFGRRNDPVFVMSITALQSPTEDNENHTSKRPDQDDAKTLYDESTPPRKKKTRKHPGTPEQRPISIVKRNDAAGEPRGKDNDLAQQSVAVLAPHERLRMIRQPETRPIGSEQLICGVKGIYAGIIMVEARCCKIDAKQHQAAREMDSVQPVLNNGNGINTYKEPLSSFNSP
jgi:hypothetical protein